MCVKTYERCTLKENQKNWILTACSISIKLVISSYLRETGQL